MSAESLLLSLSTGLVVLFVAAGSRLFTAGGTAAAAAMGALFALAGGLAGAGMYFSLFALTAFATLHRLPEKAEDLAVAEAAGARTAAQVLAKTVVAGACAVGPLLTGNPAAFVALSAAPLAVAVADTWSSELGVVYGRAPKLILSRLPVAPGRSGGVTLAGSLLGLAGAASVAVLAAIALLADASLRSATAPAPWRPALAVAAAALAGGFLGMAADSVLGETAQGKWRCRVCGRTVESPAHCGEAATESSGLPFVSNPAVNLLSSLAGGGIGLLLLRALTAVRP